MAAFNVLGGGATAGAAVHKSYSKPSQLHYFNIVHLQSPKIKIRAFSISSCSRAENSKLRNDVGVDYIGRRFTIGDVVDKDILLNFNFNQPKTYLQTLAAATIGLSQVAAIFLVKVSFWASVAASGVAGLVVAVSLLPVLGIVSSRKRTYVLKCFRFVLLQLWWGGTLAEIINYYVFGQGDPNQGIEEKRWKMVGQYIALNGGVVTAEEIAPYLDPQLLRDDESYMLPVLQLFNGHPKVDEEGNILYHFPSMHCTPLPRSNCGKEYAGRWVDRDIQVDKFLKESEWKLVIYRDAGVLDFAVKLFLFKLVCSMLGAFTILRFYPRSYVSYIFVPLLMMYVIYAPCFGAIASKRVSSFKKINAEIIKRNEVREGYAKALELPDLSLKRKLSRARDLARRSSITNNRIIYNNEKDLHEQQDYERREWDRRLEIKVGNGIKDSKEKTMKPKMRK